MLLHCISVCTQFWHSCIVSILSIAIYFKDGFSSVLVAQKESSVTVTLRTEGYTYRKIAQRLGGGATFSAIRKLCLKFDETRSVADKRRTGRGRISTARDDRNLVRMSLSDRRKRSRQLMVDWKVPASVHTVRRRLIKAGLKARIPRKKPFLNSTQRSKRVQWAKAHVN